MKEAPSERVPKIEYHWVFKEVEFVCFETLGLPPKRDIEFSIYLVPVYSLKSKTPYKMITLQINKVQMFFKVILNKGYICPSISPWGV